MRRFGLASSSPSLAAPSLGMVAGAAAAAGAATVPYEELLLADYASGLVGYFPLAEDVLDGSVNGNDPVASSGISYAADAPTGFASDESAAFDGSGSQIRLEDTSYAFGLSQFTISCWFKKTGAGDTCTTAGGSDGFASGDPVVPLVTKGRGEADLSNQDCNWFLGLNRISGGSTYALAADFEHIEAVATNNHRLRGGTLIEDGVWYHAAFTFDGTDLKLYLDGVLDGSVSAGGFNPRNDSIQKAGIGTAYSSTAAADGFFAGNIAGVAIWDYALPVEDLAKLHGAGSVYVPPVPEPEPEWFFNASDFGAIDNGTGFDNWNVDELGSFVDADGVHIVQSSTDRVSIDVAGLSASTDYWLRLDVSAVDPGAGNVRLMAQGNDASNIGEASAPTTDYNFGTGVQSAIVKVTTDATAGPHRIALRHASASGNGDGITFTMGLFGAAEPDSLVPTAVLGDRTGGYTAPVGAAVDALLASFGVSEIVTIGDGAGTGGTEDYDDLNDVLAASMGGVGKIWPNMGNHDYDHVPTDPDGFLTYFPHVAAASPGSGDLATYYSKVIGNCEFFFVDDNAENSDNAGAGDEAAQRADTMGQWLLGALAASSAKWKIVLLHHPPRSSSSAAGDYTKWAWDWGTLGVPLVLQGHKHSIELQDWSEARDGCVYYTNGRGGSNHHGWGTIDAETVWREEDTAVSGALRIYDGEDQLTLEYWSTDNELLHRYAIARNPAFA